MPISAHASPPLIRPMMAIIPVNLRTNSTSNRSSPGSAKRACNCRPDPACRLRHGSGGGMACPLLVLLLLLLLLLLMHLVESQSCMLHSAGSHIASSKESPPAVQLHGRVSVALSTITPPGQLEIKQCEINQPPLENFKACPFLPCTFAVRTNASRRRVELKVS